MKRSIRLGMLTPSSNTVLEPFTVAMLAGVPEITAHFSRFKVTEIALSDGSLGQFELTDILPAAELLSHAKVDVIAWNGTSAGWLGFERDEFLCEAIFRATGTAACTSILDFREIFDRTSAHSIGLVTPYRDDVQAKIMANWSRAGYVCSAERHIGLQDNYSFADISEQTIAELVREVALEGCDAVAIVCTNMRGTRVAPRLEAELGIPVYDSIAATLWKSLQTVGIESDCIRGWGSLFTKLKNIVPIGGQTGPWQRSRAIQ